MFVENDLPNLYSGMYYFRKCEKTQEFFKLVEYITYNWERYFFEIAPNHAQKFFSIDVACAIAAKILGIDTEVTHPASPFTFVHMKPALQQWSPVPASCYTQVTASLNNELELVVGNFRQLGVFHYVEDVFLTDSVLEKLHG